MICSFCCNLFFLSIFLAFATTSANVCSKSLPSYDVSNSGSITGRGVQLVFPSWRFSCNGTIDLWMAHVIGNTSITDSIEFQVLEPDPVKSNVYHIVYGNSYQGADANGTRIEHSVLRHTHSTPFLPVRAGYIVGVYISPNVELSLLYDQRNTGDDDIDIYYWNNITGRTCDLSLCDANVIRGVTPLVGWTFRNITAGLSKLDNTVNAIKQNTQYCNSALEQLSNCSLAVVSSSSIHTVHQLASSTGTTVTMTRSLSFQEFPHSSSSNEYFPMSNTYEGISPIFSSTTITIPSRDSSSNVIISTTSIPTSPTQSTISNATGGVSQLQMILVLAVAGLLILCILLTCALIILLIAKCVCRRKQKSSNDSTLCNEKEKKKDSNNTDKDISTGCNPSYHQHSILPMNIVVEEYVNVGVDSNKLYDDIHIYCQPELPQQHKDKMVKFNTYDNTNIGYYTPNTHFNGHVYEDTNAL